MMYDYIPFIIGGIFVLLGLFMLIFPKQAVKKENKDSDEEIKKSRRNGIIILVAGVVFALINFLRG